MKKIIAHFAGRIISSNSNDAYFLNDKSNFGELAGEKVQYTPSEALYLVENGKMSVIMKGKELQFRNFLEKLRKTDKRIDLKYPVFKDLRDKGYIVKTGLKFGADFRIYDRGSNPKDSHAKWVAFVDNESKKIAWSEFAARNRVAHSTRKKLLLSIVDEENDITYYEISWIKI